MKSHFRTRFSSTDLDRGITCLDTPEDRRTQQEFSDDCDINKIMARYKATGRLPESALSAAAQYGDFSQIPSFAEMQEKVILAHTLFDALPATVRRQFGNDPAEFIEAAQTEEGRALMVKLGLGKEAIAAPLEASSVSGGGQPPKSSSKDDRKPNEAPKASKKESSDEV